jgi:hypothetical protein
MTRWRGLVLILIVLEAAACGGSSGNDLGVTCSKDSDCKTGLMCDPKWQQCTLTCTSDSQCTNASAHSHCEFGAGESQADINICVHDCGAQTDCAPYTTCNSVGWCGQYKN